MLTAQEIAAWFARRGWNDHGVASNSRRTRACNAPSRPALNRVEVTGALSDALYDADRRRERERAASERFNFVRPVLVRDETASEQRAISRAFDEAEAQRRTEEAFNVREHDRRVRNQMEARRLFWTPQRLDEVRRTSRYGTGLNP